MLIGAAVAILIGLLAGSFVYKQFQKATAVRPLSVDKVVVSAARLPVGTRLQTQHLRLIDWPSGGLPRGTFSRAEDCLNRALISPVLENEPILEENLAPREAGAGLPAAIPEGMRALSVRVDDVVAVAGFVTPATMVDVLVTGDAQGTGTRNTVTRTILENVRVMTAGQKVEQDKDGKPQTVSVVTLLVNPEQANKLTMASTEGKIHLALRNTIDTKEVNPPTVTRASLFNGASPSPPVRRRKNLDPAPKPQPPQAFVVELFQGDKRETHSFPNPQGN